MRALPFLLVLSGCGELFGAAADAGPGPAPEEVALREIADRGVELGNCPGIGPFSVNGLWVGRFETRSSVSGTGLPKAQAETVTRYALLSLCEEGDLISGAIALCDIAQSQLLDEAGTCAAQLPNPQTLAAVEPQRITGSRDLVGPSSRISLRGYEERWGLEAGASPPAEPAGVDTVEDQGLVDGDADGDPGVTLRGSGPVPTIAWAARLTTADFELSLEEFCMVGRTTSATTQSIVGGPATRALRGRRRSPEGGEALFVRAEGASTLRCTDLAGAIGAQLPLPTGAACAD